MFKVWFTKHVDDSWWGWYVPHDGDNWIRDNLECCEYTFPLLNGEFANDYHMLILLGDVHIFTQVRHLPQDKALANTTSNVQEKF